MKLEKIRIKNFRGYQSETEILISNLTSFIGKNDAGKSTILEALEIFFNNSLVSCEKDDLNIKADNKNIEISCVFSDFPDEIIIDTTNPTSLKNEYLLNTNSKLEIKKVYSATSTKPKEKIFIICEHPSIKNGNDLLSLKRTELNKRASTLSIPTDVYNKNINSSIRSAIWKSLDSLDITKTELPIDKEDSKKVYDTLKTYLPIYALFQSDRQSKDDDREVSDPMKIAVKQALLDLTAEIEYIKEEVQKKAMDTAKRTVEKLKEMSPDIAKVLIPEFKTNPKFDSLFKLTIKSDDNIPINKRGSGVRRLILLNFFRAEAERLKKSNDKKNIIYAFEEPETSQHPDHQRILIKAFLELSNSNNSQVLLTTHTPALAGLLPLDSLRFIEQHGHDRTVESGTDEVFEKIADTLGVIADPFSKDTNALLLLEGKSDITFITHTEKELKKGGFIDNTLSEKGIAFIPMGGCGNLKYWRTLKLAEQFGVPYCVLIDSDIGTNEESKNLKQIQKLQEDNIKAYITRKREPENYIHIDCLELAADNKIELTNTCDAKELIWQTKTTIKKSNVIETYWIKMDYKKIREVETYNDNGTDKFEFTDMFNDFLTLVK